MTERQTKKYLNKLRDIFSKDIKGVMSIPRLIMCDNVWSVMPIIACLGIDIERGSGVFWGQTMNKLLDSACQHGKYVLSIDSDSLFTPQDVIELYKIMESRPDIDAVCAMQTRRIITGAIAGFLTDEEGYTGSEILFADTIEVAYGHFGLTLIRSDKLKTLPKPWFVASPGVNNNWEDDRVDEDIDFWHKWREAGNTIHIANKVVIGHLELVAMWPDFTMSKMWQQPIDFFKKGKPENIWPLKVTEVIQDET